MSDAAKKEERSLVKKLAEVKGAVDRIAKNGHNDHFNYDFATESDIAAAVRKEMAARSLMMFPNVTKTDWEKVVRKNGGETKLCTLTVEFTVEDGDSGETRSFTIMGQGEDALDKATYKAMTGAEKYALLKLFMIPTGDDPEKDSEHRYTPAKNHQPERSTPEAAPGKRDNSTLVKFGEGKGKHIPDLTDDELKWQLSAVKKAVDANDPKWHKNNVARLTALQGEAAGRITHATGKKSAPITTSQRQVGLPVDGEEEILTASQRFFQLARESGLSGAQLTARAKGVLGKVSGFTHEDIDTLTTSIRAVPA